VSSVSVRKVVLTEDLRVLTRVDASLYFRTLKLLVFYLKIRCCSFRAIHYFVRIILVRGNEDECAEKPLVIINFRLIRLME
jgi:hypothetical protein